MHKGKLDYKTAGVDIQAADEAVRHIAELARKTHMPGVLGAIGHFGAFFELNLTDYQEPVLVTSVDGVGTKIKIACAMGRYRGIGRDLVNHCVNDILCCGADPLYFLDYLALGRMDGKAVAELATGLVEACQENRCALIGGETAEMPDIYHPGEFDIAGTIVGIVEKSRIIDGTRICKGDVLIGVASSGLHTNGFTLARRIVEMSLDSGYHKYYDELSATIGEALLAEHKSYFRIVGALKQEVEIHGIAHITGGGLIGNIRRIVPPGLDIKIDWQSWQRPCIFSILQKLGNIEESEMRRVFNLGVGMVFVIPQNTAQQVLDRIHAMDEKAFIIGEIVH